MAIDVIDGELVEAPVSVYFDLQKGDVAELEVVAEAAIAWSAALKTIMSAVEPGITLKVQLVDGDEGSLWLNTILTLIEGRMEQIARGADRYPRLMALARGLAIIVVATPLSVTSEDVWKALIAEQPEAAQLSPEGQAQIKAIFEKVLSEKIAEGQRKSFARAITKDEQIRAVGVSGSSEKPPSLTVSRSEMRAYLEGESSRVDVEDTRRRTVTMDVTLVSPVLEDAERSWKFRQPGMPEFGAVMKDRGFLDAIGRGEVHQELRFGIPMAIEIEFKERFETGLWVPVERSVVRVITPKVQRSELPF